MRGALLSLVSIGILVVGCGAARAPSAKTTPPPSTDASATTSASSAASPAPAAAPAIVRTPRSAPWESVPMVVVAPNATGKLEATVPLVALEEGVAAIDVVLSEVTDDPGTLVDLACTDGFVAREIDRAVFDAAASAKGPLSIVVELDLSAATTTSAPSSSRRFATRACARDGAGAIEGTADAAALVVAAGATWVEDPVVSTPSGPIVEGLVRRGHEVIGWDATLAAPVLATIVRTKSGGAKNVSFEVDGRAVAAPSSRTFFLPASGEWRAASALQPGDKVRAVGGGTASITRAAEPSEDLEVVRIETDSNGAFIDGLLTSDGSLANPKSEKKDTKEKAAKKKSDDPIEPPAARVAYAPATESVRWIAAPQSWDCQLDTRLEIDALPAGATAVALVIADHEAAPGARDEATCMEAAVVREIPASFIEATRAQGGKYAITLGEDEVECDAGYALSVCVRGADGRLSPVADARYGVAGASCFVGSTLIATPDGEVPIERLKRGDVVLALGPGVGGATTPTGSAGRARVTHVKAIERDDVGAIVLSNGVTLRATKDHPFFLADGSLVKAGELERGVALVSRDGAAVTVVSAGPFDQKERVFDLSVDGPHDYFAGGVLVHNY